MLDRQQQFGAIRQQKIRIFAGELHGHFRILYFGMGALPGACNPYFNSKPHGITADRGIEPASA